MKITEKQLLAGFEGLSNGATCISRIENKIIYWVYRAGRDGDGYNVQCGIDRASEISLEYDRAGTIPLMPSQAKLRQKVAAAEEKLFGTQI